MNDDRLYEDNLTILVEKQLHESSNFCRIPALNLERTFLVGSTLIKKSKKLFKISNIISV